MPLRTALIVAPLLFVSTAASAESVSGTGRAPITKDVETVRSIAVADARRQIVVELLRDAIGADRLSEVSPTTIAQIAEQIRPDQITGQTSRRENQLFFVTLTADVDGGWFRGLLDNYQVASSSQRADGNRQLLFVMLDQDEKVASNFAAPAETHVAYDRQTGGSFSDRSSVVSSSRDSSASSSRSAGAYSASAAGASRANAAGAFRASGAAAYGVTDGRDSAAGRSRSASAGGYSGSSSNAYSGKQAGAYKAASASASSRASNFADRSNVQAEVHDNVRYREDVVYQRPTATPDGGAVMDAVKGSLLGYGVQTADAWAPLSTFFAGRPPRYDALKRDARYQSFLASLGAQRAPFFLGGTYAVTHAGADPATGQSRCSGRLNASASATSDGRTLASGLFNAAGMGMSPEECTAKVAEALAAQAAGRMGPQMQNHWRSLARGAVGQDTRQLADYALVLRAAQLDMAMQADILDALQATPGVETQNFVSQSGNEMRFTVRYAGTVPLQLALYQKLRGKPAFSAMQSTAEGRSVLLCLSGCGVAR